MNRDGKPLLVLFDGHGIMFRAYFALPPLTHSQTGEPVNAVHGFASMYLKAMETLKPSHVAVVFDPPGKTFRDDLFEDYKATRQETPHDLTQQVSRVHELVEALNVETYEVPGFEADDVIATLALQAEAQGIETVIVTGDTDLLQLVTPGTRVLANRGMFSDTVLYDETKVAERYGLRADQLADYRGLKGDSSDNIPGVPGVGEKTATKLLQEFDSVENLYAHLDAVTPPKLQARLAEHRDIALLSTRLAHIRRDAPVSLDLERCRADRFDRQRALDFFRMMEFRTLAARLPAIASQTGGNGQAQSRMDLFTDGPATATAEAPPATVQASSVELVQHLVTSHDELESLARRLRDAGRWALVCQAGGKSAISAPLAGIALATNTGEAWYVPVGHTGDATLPLDEVRATLGPLLADPAQAKTFHNANFDVACLEQHGFTVDGIAHDTMLAAYLLNEKGLTLRDLALLRLGIEIEPVQDLLGTGSKQLTMSQVPARAALPYACRAVDVVLRLAAILEPALEQRGLKRLHDEVELPLVRPLVDMERTGIVLDTAFLQAMSGEMAERIASIERQIYECCGREFNINSTQQLGEILYRELKITDKPPRTKTGFSTDAAVLEALRGSHQIVDMVLEYRQVVKLKSTYVDALPALVNPATGRLHTWFSQTVAATGRLSSSDPNLQNIPVRTEEGRLIRRAFLARGPEGEADWLLLAADYSQIELRIAAHFSQDPNMIRAFQDDVDIHRATMALVRKKDPAEVTPDERRIAKAVNFGIIYGQGEFGLSQTTGLPRNEAADFIKAYFEEYAGVKRYVEQTRQLAHEQGYVSTLLGRRRYLPEINSANRQVRAAAERMAVNMPIQGTAADIIKLAMIRISERMRESGMRARMLLQVHDELIFETPPDELEPLKALVLEIMPHAMDLSVPLKVDLKLGRNWGELE